ncbi:MAG TPA: hypothetical protein VMR90_06640 [Candidatus Cybelea sp.]|nr:hypothetical protein [Candidatus Cybelea sp.]
MREWRRIRLGRGEKGVALLISIFILLLISVVAIALIVSSGTESALAGNYRSSTGVYYAALAGLEEARSRLQPKNPNYFGTTSPGFLPTPLAVGSPVYVINPLGSETVAPWDSTSPYADKQYNIEFASSSLTLPNPSPSTSSIWNNSPLNSLTFPGPLYKWVRINAVSEKSLNVPVAPSYSTPPNDSTTPVYYDGSQLNISGTGAEVLELTALAVLPNGSQKLVQYLAAPTPLNLTFNAAVTLDGNAPQFTVGTSPNFWVGGADQGSVGACSPTAPSVAAVGYTAGSLSSFEQPTNPSGVTAGLRNHYTPYTAPNPNILPVTLSANLQTVADLNALVQSITQNADVVVNGNATQANMPGAMSATNLMTIVINGDLTLSSWHGTGYGLLLVTGKFTYDPDASWDGIILLIGKGWMHSSQGAYTTTQIQGAVFLARTLDASDNPLPLTSPPIFTPIGSGSPSGFDFGGTPNTLTNGIYYSNCWIQAAMPVLPYKVLSFHEIPQQ